MNFKFNEDEQKVIDLIHEFGVNEVAPLAAEIDEQERFPEENRKRLAELGMMGICYPKEYGGGGHSYLAYIAPWRPAAPPARPPRSAPNYLSDLRKGSACEQTVSSLG